MVASRLFVAAVRAADLLIVQIRTSKGHLHALPRCAAPRLTLRQTSDLFKHTFV
jgi:hypothetical protein